MTAKNVFSNYEHAEVKLLFVQNGYLHDDSGEKQKKLFLQDDFLFWAIFNENLTFMSSANDFYRVKRGLNPAERMKRSNLS